MSRITKSDWKSLQPWDCCGQKDKCTHDPTDENGCLNGCIVPRVYWSLAMYEDLGHTPDEIKNLINNSRNTSDSQQESDSKEDRYKKELNNLLYKMNQILKKAKSYEHLNELLLAESEGRLVKLPVSIGSTVYEVTQSRCIYRDEDKCNEYCDGWDFDCESYRGDAEVHAIPFSLATMGHIGYSVFITREEAEAKAKDLSSRA